MGGIRIRRHTVDVLFTLALFCVLAASSLLVAVLGAQVYEGIAARMGDHYTSRTTLSYIVNKVRQNDQGGGVRLGKLGDGPALVMEEEIGGSSYQTWIYQSGGELRELLTRSDNTIRPEDGQSIMPVDHLEIAQVGDGLFRLSVQTNSGEDTVLVSTRCR